MIRWLKKVVLIFSNEKGDKNRYTGCSPILSPFISLQVKLIRNSTCKQTKLFRTLIWVSGDCNYCLKIVGWWPLYMYLSYYVSNNQNIIDVAGKVHWLISKNKIIFKAFWPKKIMYITKIMDLICWSLIQVNGMSRTFNWSRYNIHYKSLNSTNRDVISNSVS